MTLDGLADPRATPRVDDLNRPFFAAAASGKLMLPRCGECGHLFFYPRLACPRCWSRDLGWVGASGRGVVTVAAAVHRPAWDDLPRSTPYVVALIRLEEGPTMLSTVEGADPGAVVAGMEVVATFERLDDEVGLVRFEPARRQVHCQ